MQNRVIFLHAFVVALRYYFAVFLGLLPLLFECSRKGDDFEVFGGERFINGFVNGRIGAVQIEASNFYLPGGGLGCDSSCVTGGEAALQQIHAFDQMVDVSGQWPNGVQVFGRNGEHTLGGHEAESGLQTIDTAACCRDADGPCGVRAKGHVRHACFNRHGRTTGRSPRNDLVPAIEAIARCSKMAVLPRHGHGKFREIGFAYDRHIALTCQGEARGITSGWWAVAGQIGGAGRGDLPLHVDVVFDRQAQLAAVCRQRAVINEGVLPRTSVLAFLHGASAE